MDVRRQSEIQVLADSARNPALVPLPFRGALSGRASSVRRFQCRRREVSGHGRPAIRGKPVRGGRGIRIPVARRKALERRGYGGFGLPTVGLRTLCMEAVRPVSRPGTQKLLRTDENRRVVLFRNRMTGTKTGMKFPLRVRSYRHEPRRWCGGCRMDFPTPAAALRSTTVCRFLTAGDSESVTVPPPGSGE